MATFCARTIQQAPHAAIWLQRDTDCTGHKEPEMPQARSFKHSADGLQGLA